MCDHSAGSRSEKYAEDQYFEYWQEICLECGKTLTEWQVDKGVVESTEAALS